MPSIVVPQDEPDDTITNTTSLTTNNSKLSAPPSPLVTLHNTPLASPNAVESLLGVEPSARQHDRQVRYNRSQSTMVLPVIEVSGESSPPPPPPLPPPPIPVLVTNKPAMTVSFAARKYHHSQPRYSLYARRRSTSELLLSTVEHLRVGAAAITTGGDRGWRTRSPSPIPCGCYRCNVSELIVRSRELTPNERFNLRSYLLRSLGRRLADKSRLARSQSCPDAWLFDDLTTNSTGPNSAASSRSSSPLPLHPSRSLDNLPPLTKTTNQPLFLSSSSAQRAAHGRRGRYCRCQATTVGGARSRYSVLAQPLFSVASVFTSRTTPSSPYYYHHNYRPHLPRQSLDKIHQKRSFSSPDTRPTITQPDPAITCTARRHRHSISGQMSYFKLLGYNVNKKLTGSANSLFSTAVISGSSSAPNLKDMIPPHASAVAAIDGFGGVPPIRPLETLHNALSLRQLDGFLELMTGIPLYRTPASSPPKFPSPSASAGCQPNLGIIGRDYRQADRDALRYIAPTPIQYKGPGEMDIQDIRGQLSPTSPNSTGWSSEPQSFLSSEPSSPAPTSAGEYSMSISLVSNEDRGGGAGAGGAGDSDGCPSDNPDDDEEHTLTLKQAEERKKQAQDLQQVFEQKESGGRPSGYKKIGRFRVESMEFPEGSRPHASTGSLSSGASDKGKFTSHYHPRAEGKKSKSGVSTPISGNRKHLLRSQSVSTPKITVSSQEFEQSPRTDQPPVHPGSLTGEFEWKPSVTMQRSPGAQPALTLASSFKDSSNTTIGFDVASESKKK